MIRAASIDDANTIADIYNHYIQTSIITFETELVSAEEMAKRIEETQSQELPYLVLESNNQVLGYAYASKWKGRCAYRFSLETTVYLASNATGKQYGTQLYQELFTQLKALNYRTVIGGISLPNPASIALHEKMGMQKVAHFKDVGFKFNQWIDVGYWQKQL
ncbi:MAG: N-acetyltransferase family protein [Gammaproteobacteria bacterium]|nr:N-acetyltransferase family protein [Gammaproteobacteria bacterium]